MADNVSVLAVDDGRTTVVLTGRAGVRKPSVYGHELAPCGR